MKTTETMKTIVKICRKWRESEYIRVDEGTYTKLTITNR